MKKVVKTGTPHRGVPSCWGRYGGAHGAWHYSKRLLSEDKDRPGAEAVEEELELGVERRGDLVRVGSLIGGGLRLALGMLGELGMAVGVGEEELTAEET